MMMLRRYLVTEEPILKPCASRLDTVPSAAPFEVAERQRVGPREGQLAWNPSVGEHRGVVTAIGAEVASVLAAVFRAYPLAEHPPSDLNL